MPDQSEAPIERLAEHLCARRPCGDTPENVADWLDYSLNRCGLVVIEEQRPAQQAATPAAPNDKPVCAQCRGMRADLPVGREPEELCDPCYDDATPAAPVQDDDAEWPIGRHAKLDELIALVAFAAARESGNGYDQATTRRHAARAAKLWQEHIARLTPDRVTPLVEALVVAREQLRKDQSAIDFIDAALREGGFDA